MLGWSGLALFAIFEIATITYSFLKNHKVWSFKVLFLNFPLTSNDNRPKKSLKLKFLAKFFTSPNRSPYFSYKKEDPEGYYSRPGRVLLTSLAQPGKVLLTSLARPRTKFGAKASWKQPGKVLLLALKGYYSHPWPGPEQILG